MESQADDDTRHQAVREWARLTMEQGPKDKVATRVANKLEAYLAKNPDVIDLRITLSGIYESQSRITEARRVLRDGLDRDRTGVVHAHLGGIYERNGSPDIALSYYEEALRLQPGNESLKKLIEKLQGQKTSFEDPTTIKPRPTGSASPRNE